MNMKEAVAKAAKLLKLAKSDNPHEAALAAARAQEIIDRYKLSGMDLELDPERKSEDEEPVREWEEPLDKEDVQKAQMWRGMLAVVVARMNQCQVYIEGGAIRLVGRASDAEAVRYLFAYLANEVNRLTKRDGYGNGRAWANNFRLGCVDTIHEKLKAQRAETVQAVQTEAKNPNALVLVRNALARMEKRLQEADQHMRESAAARGQPLRQDKRRYRTAPDARALGRKAAEEIKLGAKTTLAGGYRGLGDGQ